MKKITYRLSALVLALALLMLGSCEPAPDTTTTEPDTTEASTTVSETTEEATTESAATEDTTEEAVTEKVFAVVTATVAEIAKHGNLILDVTGAALFDQGYEYGDMLEITVAGQTMEVPLCSNYSDVDNGVTVLRAASAESAVVLAINMGDLATTAGIAVKSTIEERLPLGLPDRNARTGLHCHEAGGRLP